MNTKERLLKFLSYLQIGQTKFEDRVGLSRGLVNNIKGGISSTTLLRISKSYPELDTNWLLTGEGEMLRPLVSQSSTGDHSPNINGDGNAINDQRVVDGLMTEVSELRRMLQSQLDVNKEQFDRLVGIIGDLSRSR